MRLQKKRMLSVNSIILGMSLLAAFCNAENKKTQVDVKSAATVAPAAGEETGNSDTLVIKGQLIEAGTMAPNDLYNYVFIVKYKVLSVEKGKYGPKEILVGHYNPLIPRGRIKDKMDKFVSGNLQKFQIGDLHRLVLVTPVESVWKDAVEDEYIDSDLPRYYALQADLVGK